MLQALLILSRLGKARDPRAADALDLLLRRRRADGRWQPGGCWWRPPGTTSRGSYPVEVVDWGRSGPNELITLNALRVLHAAGWPGRPAPAAPDSSSDEPQPAGRHGPEADTPLGGREQDQRTERSQRWSS